MQSNITLQTFKDYLLSRLMIRNCHRFHMAPDILHRSAFNEKYFKHFTKIKKKIHIMKNRFPYYIIGIYVLIIRIFRNVKTAF
jgi:hypothetical protein